MVAPIARLKATTAGNSQNTGRVVSREIVDTMPRDLPMVFYTILAVEWPDYPGCFGLARYWNREVWNRVPRTYRLCRLSDICGRAP